MIKRIFNTAPLAAILVLAIVASAFAADYPAKGAPQLRGVFDWTGFYVGANGGYAWNTVDGVGIPVNTDPSGAFGGGQVGFRYQFRDRIVAGVRADIDLGGIDATKAIFGTSVKTTANLFGTARADVGYAFDGFLAYATAGLAWQRTAATIGGLAAKGEATNLGLAVGAGIETPLWNNVSVFGEYLYFDFGKNPLTFSPGVSILDKATSSQIRLGINAKFGTI